MDMAVFFMAMPPVQISFHNEENYNSENQVGEYRAAFTIFQTFRKDMQEGAADQCARREADQTKKNLM